MSTTRQEKIHMQKMKSNAESDLQLKLKLAKKDHKKAIEKVKAIAKKEADIALKLKLARGKK